MIQSYEASCRGVSDDGLAMLSALASLELLAMNNMDAAVTGAALTSLQGENICTAMQTHATTTQG